MVADADDFRHPALDLRAASPLRLRMSRAVELSLIIPVKDEEEAIPCLARVADPRGAGRRFGAVIRTLVRR